MAVVTIDIPNIGKITAENAATEETLLKLVAAIEKANKASGAGAGGKKEQEDLIKQKKEETDQSKKQTKELTNSTKEFVTANKATAAWVTTLKAGAGNITTLLGSFSKAAISLTAQMATQYDAIATNPIAAGAGMLSTGIDLMAKTAKVGTSALGVLPIVGAGLKAAGDAAIDLAATLTKTANDVMAKEFQKTVTQLQNYTKAGASFAGGMIEMRTVAHEAGVTMEILGKAAAAASNDIRTMGLTQGEGVKAVGSALKALATTTGSSGNALRDELLAMGYSYEEQGAIAAQVMAGQKAAGDNRKMSDRELAETTRTYAKDLKVLADITGKDAKKAMEEAQKKSMEADIMAQLSPEEASKFQKAYAAMPDYAKKGFLQYVSSGGSAVTDVATNIAMSQNKEMETLIKGTYDSIKDPSQKLETMQKGVLDQTARVSAEQENLAKSGGAVIGMVSTLTGGMSETAKMQNDMIATGRTGVGAAEKSANAADAQATATDGMTEGFQKATNAGVKLAATMEELATSNLGSYAKLLGNTMEELTEAFKKGIDYINGRINAPAPATEQKKLTDEMKSRNLVNPGTTTDSGMDISQMGGGAAMGGVYKGPDKGYMGLLHGEELIIPKELVNATPSQDLASALKESAPTSAIGAVDNSGLLQEQLQLMTQQMSKLDEMIRVLQDNRDYAERLLYSMN